MKPAEKPADMTVNPRKLNTFINIQVKTLSNNTAHKLIFKMSVDLSIEFKGAIRVSINM